MPRASRAVRRQSSPSASSGDDIEFHRRSWRLQRIGQGLVAAIVVAGSVGFFGGGGISRGRISDPAHRIDVSYERIVRAHSPFAIRVTIAPELVRDGEAAIWLANGLFAGVRIENLTPRPLREEFAAQRVVYHFAAAGDGPMTAVFWFDASGAGRRHSRMGVVGGPEVELDRWVMP